MIIDLEVYSIQFVKGYRWLWLAMEEKMEKYEKYAEFYKEIT